MATYNEMLQTAREYLKIHGIADADVDAWYLLAHVLGITRADFFMHRDELFPKEKADQYMELISLRASHIPLQHLTKTQEFMGLKFDVNEDVLIPRQDTECLVEEVLKFCAGKTVLDLCTGSGCIIISLAKLGSPKHGTAVDISEKALTIAKRNARKHGAEVEFIQSDLYNKVAGEYDIIVSNPPYIRTGDIASLMAEVKDHEPRIALEAGLDGLDFYRRIIDGLPNHLKKGGRIFFEIGCDQGKKVSSLLKEKGFTEVQIKQDLSGLDRIVCGCYLPHE